MIPVDQIVPGARIEQCALERCARVVDVDVPGAKVRIAWERDGHEVTVPLSTITKVWRAAPPATTMSWVRDRLDVVRGRLSRAADALFPEARIVPSQSATTAIRAAWWAAWNAGQAIDAIEDARRRSRRAAALMHELRRRARERN
jgi:hypothetical protein